jgi:hypothetical protein
MDMAERNRLVLASSVAVAILVIGVVAGLLISHHAPTTTPSTSSSSVTTSLPTSSTTTTTLDIPVFNYKYNARSQVTPTSCTFSHNEWTSEGNIHDPKSYNEKIELVIDFVNTGATVIDTKLVTVDRLGAHDTHQWSVSGAAGYKNLGCAIQYAMAFRVN